MSKFRSVFDTLRTNRNSRPVDLAKTPVGELSPVFKDLVDSRFNSINILTSISGKNCLKSVEDEVIAELQRMTAYVYFRVAERRDEILKQRTERFKKVKEDKKAQKEKVKKEVLTDVKPEELTDDDILVETFVEFMSKLDLDIISPNQRLTAEERKTWGRFILVDVEEINGSTMLARRMTNNSQVILRLAKDTLHPEYPMPSGKVACLECGTAERRVLRIIPLGPNADRIGKTFNSLFKK